MEVECEPQRRVVSCASSDYNVRRNEKPHWSHLYTFVHFVCCVPAEKPRWLRRCVQGSGRRRLDLGSGRVHPQITCAEKCKTTLVACVYFSPLQCTVCRGGFDGVCRALGGGGWAGIWSSNLAASSTFSPVSSRKPAKQ